MQKPKRSFLFKTTKKKKNIKNRSHNKNLVIYGGKECKNYCEGDRYTDDGCVTYSLFIDGFYDKILYPIFFMNIGEYSTTQDIRDDKYNILFNVFTSTTKAVFDIKNIERLAKTKFIANNLTSIIIYNLSLFLMEFLSQPLQLKEFLYNKHINNLDYGYNPIKTFLEYIYGEGILQKLNIKTVDSMTQEEEEEIMGQYVGRHHINDTKEMIEAKDRLLKPISFDEINNRIIDYFSEVFNFNSEQLQREETGLEPSAFKQIMISIQKSWDKIVLSRWRTAMTVTNKCSKLLDLVLMVRYFLVKRDDASLELLFREILGDNLVDRMGIKCYKQSMSTEQMAIEGR